MKNYQQVHKTIKYMPGTHQTSHPSVSSDYAEVNMGYPVSDVPTHANSCKVGNGTIPTSMSAPSKPGDQCC